MKKVLTFLIFCFAFFPVIFFTSCSKSYNITWKNADGSVLMIDKVLLGATPEYKGDTPTKEKDAENTYTFSNWSPEIVAATKDATYTSSLYTKFLLKTVKAPSIIDIWISRAFKMAFSFFE